MRNFRIVHDSDKVEFWLNDRLILEVEASGMDRSPLYVNVKDNKSVACFDSRDDLMRVKGEN